MDETKKIIIIGNGFDLNLGLKTSYGDFVRSAEFINLRRSNPLIRYLSGVNNANNWVNIELELTKYSQNNNDVNFEKNYLELKDCLKRYLANLDYSKINTKSSAYQILKQELTDDTVVYNFNYTSTVMSMLLGLKKVSHQYVHGSLAGNEIIFGVEDYVDIPKEHIFLKKSFSKIFMNHNLQKHLLVTFDKVIFLGHSLGESDHAYFFKYFDKISDFDFDREKRIDIYYYQEAGYKDIMIQLDSLTKKRITGLKSNNILRLIDLSTI